MSSTKIKDQLLKNQTQTKINQNGGVWGESEKNRMICHSLVYIAVSKAAYTSYLQSTYLHQTIYLTIFNNKNKKDTNCFCAGLTGALLMSDLSKRRRIYYEKKKKWEATISRTQRSHDYSSNCSNKTFHAVLFIFCFVP